MFKKQMWRELIAFSVLLIIGMVLSFGEVLDIPLPNPRVRIEAVFISVTEYIGKLLS